MKFTKKVVGLALAAATALSLAACGNSSSNNASNGPSASAKQTINVWGWDPTLKPIAALFQKENPNITVHLTNPGTGVKAYGSLNNAIQAGKGAPDVAQIEYYALPQYVIKNQLANLDSYAIKGYKDFYKPGPWSSVNINGGIYGAPMDSGPYALFYNKAVFDKAGIKQPPTTWDEFYQDAKALRKIGSYITSDSGDAGFFDGMSWAAGAKPFSTKGTTVSINLTANPQVKKWEDFWQKMISEGLIDTKTAGWSDGWYKAMDNGSIASQVIGAWFPGTLATSVPDGAGKWRVAQTPTFDGTQPGNAESGGSSLAMLASSEHKAAAYKFMDFVSHNREAVKVRLDNGGFPADAVSMQTASWLDTTTLKDGNGKDVAYFGGQKFNQVLAQAAKNVVPGYQFLPFEVQARNIFPDSAGAAFTGSGTTLAQGVAAWQSKLIDYAKQQGFTVSK